VTELIELMPKRTHGFTTYPAVKTTSKDIELMFHHKVFGYLDLPPSHNVVVTSEYYGHLITFVEEEDGTQILSVSDHRDDAWIATQPLRKHWLMP
jgi:hypothetical protein